MVATISVACLVLVAATIKRKAQAEEDKKTFAFPLFILSLCYKRPVDKRACV